VVSIILLSSSSTYAQTMLADKVAYYPRVVRLPNSNDVLIASFDNGNTGAFYESKDNGNTWVSVSNLIETTSKHNYYI